MIFLYILFIIECFYLVFWPDESTYSMLPEIQDCWRKGAFSWADSKSKGLTEILLWKGCGCREKGRHREAAK